MIGSAWLPTFVHVQMYRSGPQVAPPSLETFSMMNGSGHWFPHAVGPVYRVVKR